jgi:uncharacterized protein (DUF111 family)
VAVERKRSRIEGELADGSVEEELVTPAGKAKVRWALPDDEFTRARQAMLDAAGFGADNADDTDIEEKIHQ